MKKRLQVSAVRKRIFHRNKHKLTYRRQAMFIQQEMEKANNNNA